MTPTGSAPAFRAAEGDGGTIQIISGAQINALQQNSYVALVAPRVEQGGTVKVDGSAAYVAAMPHHDDEPGPVRHPVDAGTDDPNGIVHTGSTTGATQRASPTTTSIYLVAVPRNQALTMLLGGTVGFDANDGGL